MATQANPDVQLVAAIARQPPIRGNRTIIIEAAERQIQQWQLSQRNAGATAPKTAGPPSIGPYLTISREAGAEGGRIARMVGEIVGWEVFDRELLEVLAEKYQTTPDILELVDETTASWISETFGNWLVRSSVTQAQYVTRLSKMIYMVAQRGNVIFVGRGAQFLLPQDRGLNVRLVAPLKYRLQQIMERRRLGEQEARDYIEITDTGRRDFVRNYFHHDADDPHTFDLVVNVAKLGSERAARLIADTLRSCFPTPAVTVRDRLSI